MTPEPRTSRSEQILDATLGVVKREGWSEISMRRVGDAAGITATALYRHFRNKDDLVRAAAGRAGSVLSSRIDAAMAEATTSESRLWAGLEEIRRFATDDPEWYRFVFLGPRIPEPGATRKDGMAAHPSDAALASLTAQISAWMSDVDLAGDPEEIASVVMAQAHGLVVHWLQGRFATADTFADFYRRAFWIMLAGVGKQ